MKFKKISYFVAYETLKNNKQIDNATIIELVDNSEEKSKIKGNKFYNLSVKFEQNKGKSDSKRYFFDNKNYINELKLSLKEIPYLLSSLVVATIIISIISYFRTSNILMALASATALGWIYQVGGLYGALKSHPKSLILQNGYIKELNSINFICNSFFFNEIRYIENEKYNIVYFYKKNKTIGDSIILFSENNESSDNNLKKFFKNFAEICEDVKFQEVD